MPCANAPNLFHAPRALNARIVPGPRRRSCATFFPTAAAIAMLAAAPATSFADELDVPSRFATIQAAIDAATSGDEVIVQPGVYAGPGNTNLNFDGRLITLRSIAPSSPKIVAATVIDCQAVNGAFLFDSGETPAARVEGFTILNGAANLLGTIRTTMQSDPTFADCVIRDCAGMAIRCTQQGRITLERCTVVDNDSGSFNAASLDVNYPLSGATIHRCVFRDNVGGAINFAGEYLIVEDSRFERNATAGSGGAIRVFAAIRLELRRCWFVENTAEGSGGAVYFRPHFEAEAVKAIESCAFIDNATENDGGGLYIPPLNSTGDATLANCTFLRNSAAGAGGNVAVAGRELVLRNCILRGGLAPTGPQLYLGPGNPNLAIVVPPATGVLQFTNLPDGPREVFIDDGASLVVGDGVTHGDPLFEDEAQGDIHLTIDSPARNAGNAAFVTSPGATDIDGEPRIIGAGVEMGADEFRLPADVNADGTVTIADIVSVITAFGSACPPPCAQDINGDGNITIADITAVLSAFGSQV